MAAKEARVAVAGVLRAVHLIRRKEGRCIREADASC
jgi:hypothetical protein